MDDPKKILIISIIDVPNSAPSRLHHFVNYLKNKYRIQILCIFDPWKMDETLSQKYSQNFIEIRDNIKVEYFTQRGIPPFIQEILSPLLLRKYLKNNNDFNILLNYNTLSSGRFLSSKMSLPMVFDIADDLPDMIGNNPQIPIIARSIGKLFGTQLLHSTIARSSHVIGTVAKFQEKFQIPEEKYTLIPNGVDTDHFRPVNCDRIKSRFDLKGSTVLGYVGVLREWVDLSPVYGILGEFDNVKLLVVGEEGNIQKNRDLVEKFGVKDKVIFTGTILYNDLPEYISAMDVGLIPFRKNETTNNAFPLKLLEYMASEKPVISSRLSSLTTCFSDRILFADTSEEYRQHINKFLTEGIRQQFLTSNRDFVINTYSWHHHLRNLEAIIEKHSNQSDRNGVVGSDLS